MALYEAVAAKLGHLEGTGFLFSANSKTYRGVFFVDIEYAVELERLYSLETPVHFEGTLYSKEGTARLKNRAVSLDVDMVKIVSVRAGERADLEARIEA